MATFNDRVIIAQQIDTKINELLDYKIEDLIRGEDLGNQLSFKGCEPVFKNILDLVKQLSTISFAKIPFDTLKKLHDSLVTCLRMFDQIKSFAIRASNASNIRDNIIQKLESTYHALYEASLLILTFENSHKDDLLNERNKVSVLIKKLESDTQKINTEGQEYLAQIKDVLDKTKQVAVEAGVAQYALIFKTEAEENEKAASFWLNSIIGILITLIIAAVVFIFIYPENSSTVNVIHFTATKIIILTTLFYGLSICTKNYKAHKHNQVLNKHRQNALLTFETFSKAAGGDIQVKNAVLLEATHTIFSNQHTGYLTNDSDNDSPNKIIEIIKDSGSNK